MLNSRDVESKHFTPTSFRRGYDEREVDDFLDEVVATLKYYEQGGHSGPLPAPTAKDDEGGWGSKASRWLRGDPPSS